MSGSTAKWTSYATVSNLIAQANLNGSSVTSGAWATGLGSLFDNTTNLSLYLDIELVLASAVTAGSGTPRVDIYLVPVPDGTNPPNPPGTGSITSSNAPPGTYFAGSILATASQSFTRGVLRGVILPPSFYGVVLQNNLGVAFPTSASNSLTGYRYGEQAS